jgi:EmrB/QacA subfamily drug resistance transporter
MKRRRLVIIIAIFASFVAFLDGSVINVALPVISRELGGGVSTQQWIVDAYAITLGALMLTAGSLSDIFGRKKILIYGLIGFGTTSIMCAIAPTDVVLILSRALQGLAGALLVPSSLALIISEFSGKAQAKAIGTWTAWTGIAFLIGPLLGGFLVDVGSWRWIFAINVLPIALTLLLLNRLKTVADTTAKPKIDLVGSLLAAAGLGGTVFALIEGRNFGWDNPLIYGSFIGGLALLIGFVMYEQRASHPMLPLNLFKTRNFAVGNIATISIYGGLSIATFVLAVFLQQVGKYSALEAGLALLPVTIIMFFLSSRFGALSGKFGPRLFMGIGPIIAGIGFLLMLFVDSSVNYWTVLPGVLAFGLGLSMTVAPLTSAILGSISGQQAGIGSAVNNAISRIAGLVTIALIGIVTGPLTSVEAFDRGILLTAGLLMTGGLISLAGIRNHTPLNHKTTSVL